MKNAAAPSRCRRSTKATRSSQRWYQVPEATSERLHAVSRCCDHFRPASTLAFCNTKQQCRDLVEVLQAQGFSALALFGELEQRERDQVLVQFSNRSCSVLVATDVAARGLDIAQLAAVINVDVTPDAEVHIHRIGRTGRAGEEGWALNLASMDEMGHVGKIEQLQGRESEWHKLAELTPASKGEPLLPPMATLQIVGGRKEKIRAGDVLGALTGDCGFTKRAGRQDQRQRVLDLCGGRPRHGACCRASFAASRNATTTASKPKIDEPTACPISTPAAPWCEPHHANGIVPSVARPQLNAVDSSGCPRLLNDAFATNSPPAKKKLGASQLQNSEISSAARPSAENARISTPWPSASTSHAAATDATMNSRLSRSPSCTRRYWPAPRFCARIGPTAPLSA
jgi:superfamily II DNA/RNA helicase